MTRFVDTNVVLYASSSDPAEAAKREVGRAILDSSDLAFSTQVLGEFYVQVLRQGHGDRHHRDLVLHVIAALRRFPIQAITVELVVAAIATQQQFRISYWDAAIVEAARALGCAVVLTEDLQDGMDFDGVIVENPFRGVA